MASASPNDVLISVLSPTFTAPAASHSPSICRLLTLTRRCTQHTINITSSGDSVHPRAPTSPTPLSASHAPSLSPPHISPMRSHRIKANRGAYV
ncbi:hypothetical protein ARMGADRAFT_786185 [Armillaria gallica]|uniref:Uncharacterized protein n=1 Tax=Armillaria gallica TaxID=47427 RepID=A0A2H3DUA0_ARMGA|nr:hypothetical protein ARMGADRAFT_786185 [Armillaria gallica]